MKKLVLVFTLFIGAVSFAQAQDKKTTTTTTSTTRTETRSYEAVAARETDKLDKIVKLTPDQKTAINSINLSLARRAEMVNANGGENKQELLTQLENARVNMYMQKLTDEQAAKFKASTSK